MSATRSVCQAILGNVEQISNGTLRRRVAGEALTAGAVVYAKTTDGDKAFKADYSAAATALVDGIVMIVESTGAYVWIASADNLEIDIGGTTTVGVEYYLGASGAIVLRSDVTTGKYVSRIASGKTTTNLVLGIHSTGNVSA